MVFQVILGQGGHLTQKPDGDHEFQKEHRVEVRQGSREREHRRRFEPDQPRPVFRTGRGVEAAQFRPKGAEGGVTRDVLLTIRVAGEAVGGRTVARGVGDRVPHVVVELVMVEVVVLVECLRQPQGDAVDDREQVVEQPRPEERVVQEVVGHALIIRAVEEHEQRPERRQGRPRPGIEHLEREEHERDARSAEQHQRPVFPVVGKNHANLDRLRGRPGNELKTGVGNTGKNNPV